MCVGALKEVHWRDACAEYLKRLRGVSVVEVDEERLPAVPSAAEIARGMEKEGERLLEVARGKGTTSAGKATAFQRKRTTEKSVAADAGKETGQGACRIALCVEGAAMGSEELAAFLEEKQARGFSHVAFFIGGSYGLSDKVKNACGLRLSLSAMTLPHGLARVMLLEQLYRAQQINGGGKYHK